MQQLNALGTRADHLGCFYLEPIEPPFKALKLEFGPATPLSIYVLYH